MSNHSTVLGYGHKTNQDSWSILNTGRVHALVVCDGHGDNGHKVSQFVCPVIAHTVLSFVLDAGGFDSHMAIQAIQKALKYIESIVKKRLEKDSSDSGCTVAGFILDTETGTGFAFTVGDSLVFLTTRDTSKALPLQNANNAPQSMIDMADRSRAKLIGIPSGSNSRYMLFPGTSDGLQLYSTIGDFDLKKVNPLVRINPIVMRFIAKKGKTRFIVASDGYLDDIPYKALSSEWYATIERELESSKGDARDLVKMAESRGSTDDITVITYEY